MACRRASKNPIGQIVLFKFWDVDFLRGTMKGQCKKKSCANKQPSQKKHGQISHVGHN